MKHAKVLPGRALRRKRTPFWKWIIIIALVIAMPWFLTNFGLTTQ